MEGMTIVFLGIWTVRYFWLPLIISGTGEVRTSNLADPFTVPSKQNPIKIWEKGSVGVSRDYDYPILGTLDLLSQERMLSYGL